MKFVPGVCSRLSLVVAICAIMVVPAGCFKDIISPYDVQTREAIFNAAKQVDHFYLILIETDENNRSYAAFSDMYMIIEAELNTLVLRNSIRKLNEDSLTISEQLLDLWKKHRQRHKEKDAYSTGTAKLDRKRFMRMFTYAARAEEAKRDATKR